MERKTFTMPKHLPMTERAPVEPDNPAIVRYSSMCFHCGNCRWSCLDQSGVMSRYTLEQTGNRAVCIYCGQCVNGCPGFAMSEREDYPRVSDTIKDGRKTVIANTSPAVRASIAEAFGLSAEFSQGKLVALLKRLGFNYVFDTNFGADLTVMEEASELVSRIRNGGRLPLFTSCCPSWVRFAELFYPQVLESISGAKSPVCMQGAIVKACVSGKLDVRPENIVNVAITPCTSKKYEILRDGMDAAGEYLGIDGMRDMDIAITTRELAKWAKEEDIDFASLPEMSFDSLNGTGAAAIFGASGGVAEAALRTAYFYLNGKNPPESFFELNDVRGSESVREAVVDMDGVQLRAAVIYGTKNAGEFIEKMEKDGAHYDFVEVMACPGGCSGGGGQPKGYVIPGLAAPEKRMELLYDRDRKMECRLSHENPEIIRIYGELLKNPGSDIAVQLLHTEYRSRGEELKGGSACDI